MKAIHCICAVLAALVVFGVAGLSIWEPDEASAEPYRTEAWVLGGDGKSIVSGGVILEASLSGTDVAITGVRAGLDGNVDLVIPDKFVSEGTEYDIVSITSMGKQKTHSISLTGIKLELKGFFGAFNGSDTESVFLENVESVTKLSFFGATFSNHFYNSTTKTVTIRDSSLGNYDFKDCRNLVSASVSGGDIPESMFEGCEKLSDVALTNVDKIGAGAFSGCTSLGTIDLSGVRCVEDRAFAKTGIGELIIPSSVEEMSFSNGDGTTYFDTMDVRFVDNPYFSSEGGLVYSTRDGARTIFAATKEFSTPDLVLEDVRVGEGVFRKNAVLRSVEFRAGTVLGKEVFFSCPNLKTVKVSTPDFSIPENAFSQCKALENVEISGEGCVVERGAFEEARIKHLDLSGVSKVGDSAFHSVIVDEPVRLPPSLSYVGDFAFAWADGTVYHGWVSEAVLPNLTHLGRQAFLGQVTLKEVRIGPVSEAAVPARCFEDCKALERVTLDPSITSVGDRCFEECAPLASVDAPGLLTIGPKAFYMCKSLALIPGDPTSIGESAFAYSGVSEADLGGSAEVRIAKEAFWRTQVEKVVLGSASVGELAFRDCKSLASLRIGAGSVGARAFSGCTAMRTADLGAVSSIGDRAFEDCNYLGSVGGIAADAVGERAFSGCMALESVSFTSSELRSLPASAFAGCTSLKKISVSPDNANLRSDGRTVLDATGTLLVCAPGISEVTLGEDVSSVRGLGTTDVVLQYSDSLRSITVSEGSGSFSSADGLLLSKDGRTILYVPKCMQILSVPRSVSAIAEYAAVDGYTTRVVAEGIDSLAAACPFYYKGEAYLQDFVVRGGKNATLEEIKCTNLDVKVTGNVSLKSNYASNTRVEAQSAVLGPGALHFSSSSIVKAATITLTERSLTSARNVLLLGHIEFPETIDSYGAGELYLSEPEGGLISKLGGFRVHVVGHEFDANPAVKGHFMLDGDGGVLLPVLEGPGKDLYSILPDGVTAEYSQSGGSARVELSSDAGYLPTDLSVTVGGGAVPPAEGLVYEFPFGGDALFSASLVEGEPVAVSFDLRDGTPPAVVFVDRGRSVLPSEFPVPHIPGYSFKGWYSDGGCTRPYVRAAVDSDITIYAGWEKALPSLRVADGIRGRIMSGGAVYTGGTPDGEIALTFLPYAGYEFLSWGEIDPGACDHSIDGAVLTIRSLSADVTLSPVAAWVSHSTEIDPVVEVESQHSGALVPAWEFNSTGISMTGMVWSGTPSTPLIVGDTVYTSAGGVLYALSLEDGHVMHHAESSNDVGYYHALGYGDGKVVDCITGRVFDLKLNHLYDMPHPISTITFHEGYFYAFAGGELMKFSPEPGRDLDAAGVKRNLLENRITEITPYGAWGQTVAARYVGGYVYTVQAVADPKMPDYGRISVCAANLATGEYRKVDLDGERYKYIDDSCFSYYDGHVYVTTYGKGIFNESPAEDKTAKIAVLSVDGLNISEPTYVKVIVERPDGLRPATQYASAFIVSKGRGYLLSSGGVFLYNMENGIPKPISRVTPGLAISHGGLVICDMTDERGYGKVYAYAVPYHPVEIVACVCFTFGEDGSITDSIGGMHSTAGNYGSQAVRFGPNGEIVYYNDDLTVHCYRPLAADPIRMLVDDGDDKYVLAHPGTVRETIRKDSSLVLNPHGKVFRNSNPMNVFGLSSDGTWKRIQSLNDYGEGAVVEKGHTQFFTRCFVVTPRDSLDGLFSGDSGYYGVVDGRVERLDISDPASARALGGIGLMWCEKAPEGLLAPPVVTVVAGEESAFEATSTVGDIAWNYSGASFTFATENGGRKVVVTGGSVNGRVSETLYGISGTYRVAVRVNVIPDTMEVLEDGSTRETKLPVTETLPDGSVVTTSAVITTSADGDTISERVVEESVGPDGAVRTKTTEKKTKLERPSRYETRETSDETVTVEGPNAAPARSSSRVSTVTTVGPDGSVRTVVDRTGDDGHGNSTLASCVTDEDTDGSTQSYDSVVVSSGGRVVSHSDRWTSATPAGGQVKASVIHTGGTAVALIVISGDPGASEPLLAGVRGKSPDLAAAPVAAPAADAAAVPALPGGASVLLSCGETLAALPREAFEGASGALSLSAGPVDPSSLTAAQRLAAGFADVYQVSAYAGGAPLEAGSADVVLCCPGRGAGFVPSVREIGGDGRPIPVRAAYDPATGELHLTGCPLPALVAVEGAAAPGPVPSPSLSLSASSLSLETGGTARLSASPSSGAVSWATSDPAVVFVGPDGTVTAVGPGTARVTASAGGVRASCSVTVSGSAYALPAGADPAAVASWADKVRAAGRVPVASMPVSGGSADLPAALVAALAGGSLKMEAQEARLTLGPAALASLAGGAEVRIAPADLASLSEAQRAALRGYPAVDVSLYVGGAPLHSLSGPVGVSLPFVLGEGQAESGVRVLHLLPDGSVEEVPFVYSGGWASLTVDGLSAFAVVYGSPASAGEDGSLLPIAAAAFAALALLAVGAVLLRRRNRV